MRASCRSFQHAPRMQPRRSVSQPPAVHRPAHGARHVSIAQPKLPALPRALPRTVARECNVPVVMRPSVYLPRTAKYSTSSDRSNAVTVASDNALQPLDMGKMQVLDARQDGTKFVEIKWPNGDMYVGEMSADGQLKGHGAYWYHTNAQYVGEFDNDLFNGNGEFKASNGDVYEGGWLDGKQHGYGVYVLAKGGKYDGEWERGKRHGAGTYYYPDGVRIYRGEWKENMKHGRGTFTYENGDKYDGEWRNNKQHGQGTMLLKNGNIHQTEWKDGKPVGSGRLITPDGQVLQTEIDSKQEK